MIPSCFIPVWKFKLQDSRLSIHGRSKAKNLRGAHWSYGNEKYYYLWVHKQCANTPSRGSGGMSPQENFTIRSPPPAVNWPGLAYSAQQLLKIRGSLAPVVPPFLCPCHYPSTCVLARSQNVTRSDKKGLIAHDRKSNFSHKYKATWMHY